MCLICDNRRKNSAFSSASFISTESSSVFSIVFVYRGEIWISFQFANQLLKFLVLMTALVSSIYSALLTLFGDSSLSASSRLKLLTLLTTESVYFGRSTSRLISLISSVAKIGRTFLLYFFCSGADCFNAVLLFFILGSTFKLLRAI